MNSQTVISLLFNGCATGSMLFIVACGLSLIFGVTQIVNFAHGSFYMLGAYGAYTLTTRFPAGPLGFWGGVATSALCVGALGAVIEIVILRRLSRAPELFQLLATFGVVLIIQDLTRYAWGVEDLIGLRAPGLASAIDVFGVRLPAYNAFLIGLGPAILAVLWLVFHKTRWGTLVRAATEDREMVGALGVNQRWLFTSVFALGSAFAGLGGAVQLPRDAANLGMDFNLLTEAFVVTVIGGLGSIPGAFFAALLIGILQSFGTLLLPSFTLVIVFLVMTAVLVVRPYGLAGTPQVQIRETIAILERPATARERSEPWLVWGLAAAAVLVAPAILGPYPITLLTETLIFVLFAASLHLLVGPGGILSFGHAAYFGLGAYCVALGVRHLALPLVPALVAAPVAGAIGAALFGWLCVRLSGVYRAMLTLALAQILWSVALQWVRVTGGDNGVLQVRPDSWARSQTVYLYVTAAFVGGAVYLLRRITAAPFGYALRAGRDSAVRSAAIGIDIRLTQWAGFVIAGAAAGLAGGLYAFAKGSVFPDVISISTSVDGLVMILVGGIETMAGPIVGAAVYHGVLARLQSTTEYWRACLGIVIVVSVMFMPHGLVGTWRRLMPTARARMPFASEAAGTRP